MEQNHDIQITSVRSQRVAEALERFDRMPDSGFVRKPIVCALFACSPRTVDHRVQSGIIPAPVKSGNMSLWNVGKLRDALRRMEAA